MLPIDPSSPRNAFRLEARDWIRRHAPVDLLPKIRGMRFAGQPFDTEDEWLAVARDWQRRKFDAGWACLVWPTEFCGRGMGPSENVIFQEEAKVKRGGTKKKLNAVTAAKADTIDACQGSR